MIAYNKEWLYNLYARDQADEALDHGCISPAQHEAIYGSAPIGFYTPNIWGLIGIALLTSFASSTTLGYLSLLLDIFNSPGLYLICSGLAQYAVLRLFVINRLKHYNAGSDNMLMILSAGSLIGGIFTILPGSIDHYLTLKFFCSAAICTFMAIQFVDSLMSIFAAGLWFIMILSGWLQLSHFGTATVPFVMMVAAYLIYTISVRMLKEYKLVLYRACLKCVAVTSLLFLYAAGNFYMVKELSDLMLDTPSPPHASVPFGWLFWIWTMGIPFAYIAAGIRSKNSLLIRTGLVLIAVAIITYRHYYSVLSPDKAMILGGVLLALISYGLTRYLQEPKHGFTFAPVIRKSRQSEISEILSDHIIDKATTGTPKSNSDSW